MKKRVRSDKSYVHTERDTIIHKALIIADEAALRGALSGLDAETFIRWHPLRILYSGGVAVDVAFYRHRMHEYGVRTIGEELGYAHADNGCYEGFRLAIDILRPSVAAATQILWYAARWKCRPVWVTTDLYRCVRLLIQRGARLSPVHLHRATDEQYEALEELVYRRNACRPALRTLVGITMFRRRYTSMPWQLIMMMVRMARLPE